MYKIHYKSGCIHIMSFIKMAESLSYDGTHAHFNDGRTSYYLEMTLEDFKNTKVVYILKKFPDIVDIIKVDEI